jgi:hypothetical protein
LHNDFQQHDDTACVTGHKEEKGIPGKTFSAFVPESVENSNRQVF